MMSNNKRLMGMIYLTLVMGLSGCAASKSASSQDGTLYERLGGKPTIEIIVEEFVSQVTTDARLRKFFRNADIPRLKEQLTDQICHMTGGPCEYTGKDMEEAHSGLNIADVHFEVFLELFREAMDKSNIRVEAQDELTDMLRAMRNDIVRM